MSTPRATYRLQFNAGFRFEDARRLLPYLESLGISDVYASPLLQARTGSNHGYDVTDPTQLNREVGTRRQFDALTDGLRARGMGLVLDIVPNHMAMGAENPWWMDVLENGRGSRYAGFFDIDWEAPALQGKVLVPILGRPYGDALDAGEIALALEERGLVVRYFEHVLPVDPGTWGPFLTHALDHWTAEDGGRHPAVRRLRSVLRTVEGIPGRDLADAPSKERRGRQGASAKRRLWSLYRRDPDARRHLDASLRASGARRRRAGGEHAAAGDALDLLDRLLGEQAYLLANWRAAPEEVDYRRFFDIADLISVRMQEREVFEATHDLVLRLYREGRVTGFRIDHVDGLRDPMGYLRRLQAHLVRGHDDPPGGDARRDEAAPGYVVVEKILESEERLPARWPVAGTSGYEFMTALGNVLVEPGGLDRLTADWRAATGIVDPFEDLVLRQKRLVIDQLFGAEVAALSARLQRLAREDRYGRDLTRSELRSALVDVTVALPVYRTYVRSLEVSRADRAFVERAVHGARRISGEDAEPALRFLERVLLLDLPAGRLHAQARAWLAFVMRWQQFTGPVMAKGFEDTLLYVFNPLVARNEVGSDPSVPPGSTDGFHRRIRSRRRRQPGGMNATSTHDAKRSEDVRARIAVLSELPEEWAACVRRWRSLNERHRTTAEGGAAPDPNEEWLLYQTLVGVWPLDAAGMEPLTDRVGEYLRKAMREAKVHTNWIDQDAAHEDAVVGFLEAILREEPFRSEMASFAERVAWYGALNALAQVAVKATAPGVPDFYQGTELWHLRLVDPDNREPVDFALRRRLLRELDRGRSDPAALLRRWRDGRVKLWVTSRTLRARRSNEALFRDGSYAPLGVTERRRSGHVLAFARRSGGAWAVIVAPRLTTTLAGPERPPVGTDVWGEAAVRLPSAAPAAWTNALTGEDVSARPARSGGPKLRLADAFATFPLAVLVGGSAATGAA